MPDGESREIVQISVMYTIGVKNIDGRLVRFEPGGTDQIMYPFLSSLEDKLAAKQREIEKGPAQG